MPTRERKSGALTRRGFLGRVGVGAGAVAVGGLAPPAVRSAYAQTSPQVFGRMFPNLPPFAPANDRVRAALRDIGKPGGLLDARDNLAVGPVQLILDPNQSAGNPDNAAPHTAGTTFMGQFLDHDMTFDTTSRLGVPTPPEQSPNARTPSFDLDSVYGGGPTGSPQLYDPRDRAKLRIESGGLFEDVPRNADGSAIIADPRNDENLVISGLQAAFIKFHNNMVETVRSEGLVDNTSSTSEVFRAARRQTRWHYQNMILTQFLPQIVGQTMVDDILRRGRSYFRADYGGYMPVEFQTGTYRMGHSMVRPSYRANFTGQPSGKPNAPEFFGLIFDPSQEGVSDSEDLRGGSRAPRRFIGWPTFFDFGDGNVRPNKIIDAVISTPLFQLPLFAIASGDPPTSLPERNLLRHLTWSLPSGQTLAARMGVPPLSPAELGTTGVGDIRSSFLTSTPLWFYILHEALVRADGLRLGPVGGRIVGEVIIGLLQLDRSSVLWRGRWRPLIPVRESRRVKMQDILDFAGVSGLR